jgi:hypothetical protein
MKQFKVNRSTLKKGFFCLLVPVLITNMHVYAQLSGYTYVKTITIQSSKVTANQTNFPVLISFTDVNLKSVANGGHVQNSNGYDIVFTAGSCTTILPHQIELYSASTGQYVAWVNVPSLSATSNTTLYMFYGKTGVTTDPSTTAVWDANYMGVYHFSNSVADGTGNSRNLTDNSTVNLTGSKIGSGRRLNNNPFVQSNSASLKYLQLPSGMFNSVTDFTFEGWVYLEDATTSWERIFDFGRNTTYNMFLCPSINANSTGIKRFAITTNGNSFEQQLSSGSSTGTGAWHHFAVTIDATANKGVLYYDGASNATNNSMTLDPSSLGATTANYFGRSQYNSDEGLYGNFDEFRISSTVRSASWIATSYNNQSSPAAFYVVSAEGAASSVCSVLPVTLTSFTANSEQDGSVAINWVTENESNINTYVLERSGDGTKWETIKTIQAAGSSSTGSQRYGTKDPSPVRPVSYYRLRQVDVSSAFTYSRTAVVKAGYGTGDLSRFIVSPNPAGQYVNIIFSQALQQQQVQVELMNNLGMRIPVQPSFNGSSINVPMPGVPKGMYFLNVYINGYKYSRKLLIAQ